MGINVVEIWQEPTEILRANADYLQYVQMTPDAHAFLSGLIRKYRPKKILEVGVAEGTTTAMIIKSLELIHCESEIISVDFQATYKGKKVGLVLQEIEIPPFVKHRLILGKLLKDRIEEIGGDIDMVVLDTYHSIPCEILEFLTALPYMSKTGIVVLHDVTLSNLYAKMKKRSIRAVKTIATKVLFTSVSGEKYWNIVENDSNNIAAFRVDDSTFENIDNVFFSLSHLWHKGMEKELLDEYRELFSKHYSKRSMEIWDWVIKNQFKYRENFDKTVKYLAYIEDYINGVFMKKRRKSFYKYLKKKYRKFFILIDVVKYKSTRIFHKGPSLTNEQS